MRSWAVFRRRRILLALLALLAVYLFVKYIPTDVPSVAHRTDSLTGQSWARPDPFRSNPLPQKQPAQHEGTAVLSRELAQRPTDIRACRLQDGGQDRRCDQWRGLLERLYDKRTTTRRQTRKICLIKAIVTAVLALCRLLAKR